MKGSVENTVHVKIALTKYTFQLSVWPAVGSAWFWWVTAEEGKDDCWAKRDKLRKKTSKHLIITIHTNCCKWINGTKAQWKSACKFVTQTFSGTLHAVINPKNHSYNFNILHRIFFTSTLRWIKPKVKSFVGKQQYMTSNTPVLSLDLILDVMLNGRLTISVMDVHGPGEHLELRHIHNQPVWMRKMLIPHPHSHPKVSSVDVPSCRQLPWIKSP